MSALSNARWLILIQGYKVILQLVAMSVLTRLLPPSDYGLMAMAFTVGNLASLLRDLGTSSAIIQKRDLNEGTKSTVFWLNLLLGCLIGALIAGFSGVVSEAYKQPALQGILYWMAFTVPLGSLSAVHQALLERDSKFKKLARIEIVASTSSLAVAILAAVLGAGVYSFVWQSLTTTVLYVIQPWLTLRWHPRLVWDKEGVRQIFGFGANVSGFNLVGFITRNADSAIIGRFLGASALGAYSMAYKLMLFPLQNLAFVASRALFPVMSRQQDAHAELASLYLRAVGAVAAITTPMMAGLYLLRIPLSGLLFGSQWGDVAHVIAWLAPVGAIQAVVSVVGSIYMAKGRTDIMFKISLGSAIVIICAFLIGLRGGIVGVAFCYFVANIITFFPSTFFASQLIQLPYTIFLRSLLPSFTCTALMMLVILLCFNIIGQYGELIRLILSSGLGVITYFVCYFFLFRENLQELARAITGSDRLDRILKK